MNTLEFSWVRNIQAVEGLVTFFMENVTPDYISYSEIQWGRAVGPGCWSPELSSVLRSEFRTSLSRCTKTVNGSSIACARRGGALVGLAVVCLESTAPRPFATLEDMVVRQNERRSGLGTRFLRWLESEMRNAGASKVYLESGVQNGIAHEFFSRAGYDVVSKVMLKAL